MLYENRKVIVPLRLALEFKLRTHEDQGLFPSRPVLTREDPKELVERGQARLGGAFASRRRTVAEETGFRATGSDACGKGEQSRTDRVR